MTIYEIWEPNLMQVGLQFYVTLVKLVVNQQLMNLAISYLTGPYRKMEMNQNLMTDYHVYVSYFRGSTYLNQQASLQI